MHAHLHLVTVSVFANSYSGCCDSNVCTLFTIQAFLQLCGSMHLKSPEDVQSQCEIPRSDAGIDQSGVGVYVWCDATPAHVSYQSQGLAHLLSLPTQADHCMSFRPIFRIVFAAGYLNFVCRRDKRV